MRIEDAYRRGDPVFSFEFFPPRSDEAVDRLRETVRELRPLRPDFVSVTYGAGGGTRRRTIDLVTEIKRDVGLEAAAHLTCVGHTADELADVLDQLRAAGIENVLALRGDPPRGQTSFVQPEGGFGHASELAAFIRSRYDFSLGGACYPEGHQESPSKEEDLAHAKEKVDAGIDVLITQLFFEPADYFSFVERARAIGIRVPIVPGIMPITNVAQIERMTTMCGASIPNALRARLATVAEDEDAVVDVGIEWATDECLALLSGGAPGIHFYTLNRSHSTVRIFERLKAQLPALATR
jgi:methylenetetrahydrofolate reductase (NADPH)